MRNQLTQSNCQTARVTTRLRNGSNTQWACALALALVGNGCKEALNGQTKPTSQVAAPAEPDDIPITDADVPVPANYAEAVERLVGYRDAIRQAVESGHLGKAHRPLDETNIAIERLPAVARSSGVPPQHWEEIVTASDDLGEALAEIHAQIDAHRKPDYAAQAEAIDKALARLRRIAQTDSKDNSTE